MSITRVAGIDPASIRNLGWTLMNIIEDKKGIREIELQAGTVVLEKLPEDWQNLYPIFYFIDSFIQQEQPELIIIEKTSAFAGGFITAQVSHCTGAILTACAKNKTPVQFVYPKHVKKVIAGSGKATKADMKNSVLKILSHFIPDPIKFDSEHSCDAVANVLCWLTENKIITVQ